MGFATAVQLRLRVSPSLAGAGDTARLSSGLYAMSSRITAVCTTLENLQNKSFVDLWVVRVGGVVGLAGEVCVLHLLGHLQLHCGNRVLGFCVTNILNLVLNNLLLFNFLGNLLAAAVKPDDLCWRFAGPRPAGHLHLLPLLRLQLQPVHDDRRLGRHLYNIVLH